MTPNGAAMILSGLVGKLDTADTVADQFGLFDAIEKLAKREKNARRGIVEKKTNEHVLFGDLYVLHVIWRVDHPTVKYSKVVEDLCPLVEPTEFARIKAVHTSRSDQVTLRPEPRV
jgi:hypothetical protein